ncbi:auxin transporter-like protein 5 [Senna tora]|uniref:Auxin transporter-like protein 5 n=1 Tax=Senna tora TaxID=362788 RepID=A0A834XAV0_9FABA|nr:auxin transporter-like protein 5 [Senna tora]
MASSEKTAETVIVGNYVEMEREGKPNNFKSTLSNFLWHGGSVYDAWFSCSWTAYLISILYIEYRTRKEREKVDFRNHVIQWFEVLDGLLGKHWRNVGLAFNCTFLLFGSVIQLIACASNIYYIKDNLDKRSWTYIFGACCATTVFIPSFHNYRIWSFLGLLMTTYTAWYLTLASLLHGQGDNARDVEAREVQIHIPNSDGVRADADAPVGRRRVLGVRRPASGPLERLLAAPADAVARRGGDSDADPPVHHLRLRVHAAVPGVGEGDWDARVQQRVQEGGPEVAGGAPHMVLGHHIPFLWAH